MLVRRHGIDGSNGFFFPFGCFAPPVLSVQSFFVVPTSENMSVWLPPGFDLPTVPETERYEGHELDANVLQGMSILFFSHLPQPQQT